MITVTFLNQKGGVGKTSSCHHLAGALARGGRRVLLIDNDPQASLTQGLFGPQAMRAVAPAASIAAVYEPGAEPEPSSLVLPAPFEGASLVPGSEALTRWNMTPQADWGESLFGVRSFLAGLAGDYDVVLIDCPPNLHLCSWAALAASDGVVVPLQAEDYGAQGIYAIQRAVAQVRAAAHPGLAMLGYLITMFDRRLGIHLSYESSLREMHGRDVFRTAVPRAKDFVEAVAARQPVSHYKPKSAAAKAINEVAGELLERASALDTVRLRGVA